MPDCPSARLALVESKVDVISNAIDEIEDYSYQFNVKFNGVPIERYFQIMNHNV